MPRFNFSTAGFNSRRKELLCLAAVLLLMVGAWFLGHGMTRAMYDQFADFGDLPAAQGPVGQAQRNQLGHLGYFWSERAFHYRQTLMFAVDDYDPPATLTADTNQQYPDGVDAWREYTPLMEPVYGQLYRWFARSGEILVEFLLRLIPLIHVLLFLPLYLTARGAGARPWGALLAVLLYAACLLGYSRFTGSLLLKEDFALLWLMLMLGLHALAVLHRSVRLLVGAALALFMLLSSWHLGQFLVLVVLAALAVAPHLSRDVGRPSWNAPPLAYFLALLAAGFTPSLWARGFHLSPAMAVGAGWLLATFLQPRLTRGPGPSVPGLLLPAGLMVILTGASLLNGHFTGDYNHVLGLLVHKLANGFQRPDDPDSLPFAVRVFWTSPFNTPGAGQIWTKLGFALVPLFLSLVLGLFQVVRRRLATTATAVVLMAWAFVLAWLFIERMGVVMLPVAVLVPSILLAGRRGEPDLDGASVGDRLPTVLVALLLLAVVGNLATGLRGPVSTAWRVARGLPVQVGATSQGRWMFRAELLRWIIAETPGPANAHGVTGTSPLVGSLGLSPQVLLYTGRPIILNSQFENQLIQKRYRRYLASLFSPDPGQLQAFLGETGARYLFLDRHWALLRGPGSVAYMAGQEGDLDLGLNIARLHFRPETWDFLEPVFDNEFFRVFRVNDKVEQAPATWDRRHSTWWNLDWFGSVDGQLTGVEEGMRRLLDHEEKLAALQEEEQRILGAMQVAGGGRNPSLPALHQQYLELKLQDLSGESVAPERLDGLVQAIGAALKSRLPGQNETCGQALADLYLGTGPHVGQGWRQLLSAGAAEPTHLAAAGQLAVMLGQYEDGARLLNRATALLPALPVRRGDGRVFPEAQPFVQRIRQAAVWYNLAAGRVDRARDMAEQFGTWARSGSPAEAFFRRVAALPGE